MKILVTGASGYIGSRLIPALLEQGHEVRAAFTDPSTANRFAWHGDVDIVPFDALDADSCVDACQDIEAVYYLIHGMAGGDFVAKDALAAHSVADAARGAGVDRIIYLSGVIPDCPEDELSDHLASRLDVERILTGSGVLTVALRAAVILGSGSTSFEVIRQISERMPITTVPDWMTSEVQPIAVTDVVAALVGALTYAGPSRHFDVGGPEALSYPDLLSRYAASAGLVRPQVQIPLLPSGLVGSMAGMLIDVPTPTVEALVESLKHDMVCREDDFVSALLPAGHRLLGLEESITRSLASPDTDRSPADRDPMGPMPGDPSWASAS